MKLKQRTEMETDTLTTKFAPAEKSLQEIVERQHNTFAKNTILVNLINSLSQMVVVLNRNRQIVYFNNEFLNLLNLNAPKQVIGRRMGEAVNCLHSRLERGGCGTSEFCRTCGGINSILESQIGALSTKECHILTTDTNALDLRVTSTPFEMEGQQFTIFTIIDVSDEKRRQALERVFFHDVLNSAGGISGLSGVLKDMDDKDEIVEVAQLIQRLADSLIEEIRQQRQLSAAERGELHLNLSEIQSVELIKEIRDLYVNHEIVVGKNISIDTSSEELACNSDRVLLRRILSNMLKNAIEASLPGRTVLLNCKKEADRIRFSVHNHSFIPIDIQRQIFQRSFSTKGTGRGLGTYSMKLLGEKYLNGKIWFESDPEAGTTFYFQIS